MTNILSRIVFGVLLGSAIPSLTSAQANDQLNGRWIREPDPTFAFSGISPDWEDVLVDAAVVGITRSWNAARRVTVTTDGVERVDSTNPQKYCRSTREAQRVITECRDMSGGPGGGGPPLYIREVRWVDATGLMVVERTWQSAESSLTLRTKYRKAEQQ